MLAEVQRLLEAKDEKHRQEQKEKDEKHRREQEAKDRELQQLREQLERATRQAANPPTHRGDASEREVASAFGSDTLQAVLLTIVCCCVLFARRRYSEGLLNGYLSSMSRRITLSCS